VVTVHGSSLPRRLDRRVAAGRDHHPSEARMTGPILYVVEIDLPLEDGPRALATFNRWYAHVHAPHLYEAGFTTCTSYRAVRGGMGIVDIYQAPDWAVFTSERFARYRQVASADPHLPPFMVDIPNRRTPYVAVDGRAAATPLSADWIALWRFDADDDLLEETARWLAGSGFGARLLKRTREAPTGGSDRPNAVLVVEAACEPPGALPAAAPAGLRAAVASAEPFAGYRLYPWPDDTALLDRAGKG
jgi:hypothetical protein